MPRGERRRVSAAAASDEKDKKKKAPPLSVILRDAGELIAARKGRLALGFGILLVNRLAGFVLPFMPRYLLDEVLGKGRRELLPTLVAAAAGATIVQAITSFALSQILGKAAQRSITELRRRVQRHVGRLSVSYFDQTKVGSLLSRVMTDAEGIRNLVGTGLVEVVGGVLTATIALIILLFLNLKLTAIALAILSLFGFVLLYAFKTLRPLFRERSKINAEVSGRLTESFSGVRVVKAYRAERREALAFSRGVHRLFRNVAKTMTGVSQLFQFTALLALLVGPVVQIVSIGSQITEAFAGLERIREIRNEAAEDAGDETRESLPRVEGRVEFRDVSFEYQSGVPVLKGISFTAEPGTSTALVGPSGSGKSTMIGLVAAFYRPKSGQILIDGLDLSRVRLADYREQLGVVLQDNFLFDGTVFENIAYARPDASRADVLRAAAVARCDDFVSIMPDGYDTVVGERGVKLSGGQRQRVAIARAILADPRILILDEATSSLDSESEALIQEGLAELMKGRTTFVIAHRLSTIRKADTILVVEDGLIVERGRHEELLARGGRYADLYNRQYGVEANLFRNPGETESPVEDESRPRSAADSSVGRLPLVGTGTDS